MCLWVNTILRDLEFNSSTKTHTGWTWQTCVRNLRLSMLIFTSIDNWTCKKNMPIYVQICVTVHTHISQQPVAYLNQKNWLLAYPTSASPSPRSLNQLPGTCAVLALAVPVSTTKGIVQQVILVILRSTNTYMKTFYFVLTYQLCQHNDVVWTELGRLSTVAWLQHRAVGFKQVLLGM